MTWIDDLTHEWVATIRPPDHWWGAYYITLSNGAMALSSGWFKWGRKRAERKARRLIALEERRDAAYASRWEVR